MCTGKKHGSKLLIELSDSKTGSRVFATIDFACK